MFAPHDRMIIQFCALLSLIIRVTINQQLAAEIIFVNLLSSMSFLDIFKKKQLILDLIKILNLIAPISICFISSLIGFIGSKRRRERGDGGQY